MIQLESFKQTFQIVQKFIYFSVDFFNICSFLKPHIMKVGGVGVFAPKWHG